MASTSRWSSEEEEKLLAYLEQDMTEREISSKLGRSTESIRAKIGRFRSTDRRSSSTPLRTEALEMENAALRAQLGRATERVQVDSEGDIDEEPDVKQAWQIAEEDCERRVDRARRQAKFSTRFDKNEPIAVAFVSDQHIAPGTPVAMKRMREDAELIANTPGLYCCLAGDAVDNHIKIRAAVLAARSQPDDQYRLFDYYLELLAPKVLVVCSGNHDAWTNQLGGIDVLRRIAEQHKVRYGGFAARVGVTVNGVDYKIALRHQYRMNSSFNQGHAVKQWFRMGEEEFDVGVVAHHHEVSVDWFLARGLPRVAIRPGSYQYLTSYTVQYGWNPALAACPTVIFMPGTRQMLATVDVREGAKVLSLLRGD